MDWSTLTPAVVLGACSLVTAICALFIALSNYRRSNYPVVRVRATRAGSIAEVRRGYYHEFRVTVQNLGIPLHNVGMVLCFVAEDGFGSFTTPLKLHDGKAIREGQFAKGAIAEFVFATDRMDSTAFDLVGLVTDLKTQRVELVIHADTYRAWTYQLHDRLRRIKGLWNRVADWLRVKMMREVTTARGTKGVKQLFRVPSFEPAGNHLLGFAATVRALPARDPKDDADHFASRPQRS